jgi:hypothetical protein
MKRAKIAMTALLGIILLSLVAPAGLLAGESKHEGGGTLVECSMSFNLAGWSAFYSTARGDGTITCSNGQKARVKIRTKGGGITFGKSEVVGGTGTFTGARSISELFGSYAQSEAHAGAGKSADAQAMTKGTVSLALKGTGRGVDIGFAFGKFTIQRAK